MRDPQVAVILTELRSHEYLSRVRVTGAVRQPVSVPYRQGMTVLDAVLAAGGTDRIRGAGPHRAVPQGQDGTARNAYPTCDSTDPARRATWRPTSRSQPGDVITVPERVF